MTEVTTSVLAAGERIILRDLLPSDVDSHIRWRTHGEWLRYDAPWEGICTAMTAEEVAAYKKRFLEICEQEQPVPRKRATIATKENDPLGWVNRYANERFPEAWSIGIDLCEDEYLNQGIGTEALELWIEYMFTHADIHRIGLDTWSFNPRMVRVVEKLGFVHEGAQRELIQWEGERLDLVHYGMLRREWEERSIRGQ